MFKKSLVLLVSLILGASAFARGNDSEDVETQTTSSKLFSSDYKREDYIARGVIVGLAYDHVDSEIKLKYRNKVTGETFETSGKSDRGIDVSGLKVGYASMPKQGLGLNMGLTAMKFNSKFDDGKAYYNYRGEGNLTLSTVLSRSLALYGFGGANLNYVTAFDTEPVTPLGFGLQIGGGLSIGANASFELGYSVSFHQWRDDAFKDTDLEVKKEDSYVLMKGLMARATYNF